MVTSKISILNLARNLSTTNQTTQGWSTTRQSTPCYILHIEVVRVLALQIWLVLLWQPRMVFRNHFRILKLLLQDVNRAACKCLPTYCEKWAREKFFFFNHDSKSFSVYWVVEHKTRVYSKKKYEYIKVQKVIERRE